MRTALLILWYINSVETCESLNLHEQLLVVSNSQSVLNSSISRHWSESNLSFQYQYIVVEISDEKTRISQQNFGLFDCLLDVTLNSQTKKKAKMYGTRKPWVRGPALKFKKTIFWKKLLLEYDQETKAGKWEICVFQRRTPLDVYLRY